MLPIMTATRPASSSSLGSQVAAGRWDGESGKRQTRMGGKGSEIKGRREVEENVDIR